VVVLSVCRAKFHHALHLQVSRSWPPLSALKFIWALRLVCILKYGFGFTEQTFVNEPTLDPYHFSRTSPQGQFKSTSLITPGYIRLVSKQTNMILLTLFDRIRNASIVFTNEQGRDYLQDKDPKYYLHSPAVLRSFVKSQSDMSD
jgi:hypothetical protein